VSDTDRSARLYIARWPDGTATVFTAQSMEHAVDRIDEIDEPQECEVVPFDADLWLTFRPSVDPAEGPLMLCHRPVVEIDSQRNIIAAAFPVISQVVASAHRETEDGDLVDEDIDPMRWRDAIAMEADRILSPSPEFKEAIEGWWNALGRSVERGDDRD
jgi:hypothetical protein